MELLIFRIQGQRYGIDLADLDEVLYMAAIKPLPGGPGFLAGILNLRGEPLPVLDLTHRLGLERLPPPIPAVDGSPFSPYPENTRLLVTNAEGRRFAAILDGWENLLNVSREQIEGGVVRAEKIPDWIDGIALEEAGMVQLIRIRQALTPKELDLLQKPAFKETGGPETI